MRPTLIALAGLLLVGLAVPSQALDGNAEAGKTLFMTKGTDGKACMSCHPKGLTTGKRVHGKKIPDLSAEHPSEAKLRRKCAKFADRMGLKLTDAQLLDLASFTQQLPTKGFGPVPAEWQAFVDENLPRKAP